MRRFFCLLLAAGIAEVRAASLGTEFFNASENGWLLSDGITSYIGWQNAEIATYYTNEFADFIGTSMIASNAASGGMFYGNWTTARADVIGFDFRADQALQPTLTLELRGGTNWVTKQFIHVTTNRQRIAVSMDSLVAGGWGSGVTVTEAAFASLKTNIQRVKIGIVPNASISQWFYVDNIFLSRAFQWDGGPAGTGALWMASTNWFDDGIPGSNSRVVFASTGSAQVVGVDSATATGGVIQVGQMFCSVSNRVFENASASARSKLLFNGYGNVFVSTDTNTVTFRNGPSQPLELVLNYSMGEFRAVAGGAIVISNAVITETNGLGGIVKTGDGLLYLGASNQYNGGTTIQTGTVQLGHAQALGGGGLTVHGGLLNLNGSDISVAWLSGNGGAVSDLSASGGVRTLTVSQTLTTTYAGLISNGPSMTVGLSKSGTGTLWMARTNAWGGPTTVLAGSLLLTFNGTGTTSGLPVAQLGTSTVSVASGATFGGFGRVLGSVSNNGTLRPGAVTGLLAVAGDYYQTTNAVITFQIGGPTAADFRIQQMQGNPVIITNLTVPTNPIVTTNYPIVTVTGLYNRLTVGGHATLGGTLRVTLTNNYAPSNGASFSVLAASSFTGTFSTNSFQTNNLPSLGAGREWNIIYFPTGIVLTARAVGPPGVYITDATVVEGSGGTTSLQFKVILSKPATSAVTIAYATSNGTASAGSDYAAASGNLVIPAGAFTGLITVAANGDGFHEADETFTLNLTSALNATIVDNQAVGTILNDDTAPLVSIADTSVLEGGGGSTTQLVFAITLNATSALPVTLVLATSNGTANAGADYEATNLVVSIPAGQLSATAVVTVVGEHSHEPDETMILRIVSATNAVIGDGEAAGTILNDDDIPQLTISNIAQLEGDAGLSDFVFTVVLSAPSAFPVSFQFATSDGSALAGSDYTATNGIVAVAPGMGATTVVVKVSGDTTLETDEEFYLSITNATNATILVGFASGTIQNDEAGPTSGFDFFAMQIGDAGQRGDQDDPDGDGYVNLLEYATGGNPTNVDALSAVSAAWTNGLFHLRFNRNTSSVDLVFYVESASTADDASIWQGVATNILGAWGSATNILETGAGSPVTVLVTDPEAATNRFLRLRIHRP